MNRNQTDVDALMALLASEPDMPLKFHIDGTSIQQGYHVTEVKHANLNSMDCARNVDAWQELIIQLLDGSSESSQGFMSTRQFKGIVGTALESLPDCADASLLFEFAPGNGPMRKLSIQTMSCQNHEVSIVLAEERAACKPLLRSWNSGGWSEFQHSEPHRIDSPNSAKRDSCCNRKTCCS